MAATLYGILRSDSSFARHLTSIGTMAAISHAIEDVILDDVFDGELYVGFQRASCFLRQEDRYRRLAAQCQRIVIWGVPDAPVPQIPNLEFHAITSDSPLAREWFVLINTPEFATALVAQETGAGVSATPRQFQACWVYDTGVLDALSYQVATLLDEVGQPPASHDEQEQHRHLRAISARFSAAQSDAEREALAHHRAALLQARLATPANALVALDAQGAITAVSPAGELLIGASQRTLRGQPLSFITASAVTATAVSTTAAIWSTERNGAERRMCFSQTHTLLPDTDSVTGWVVALADASGDACLLGAQHKRVAQFVSAFQQDIHDLHALASYETDFAAHPAWQGRLSGYTQERSQALVRHAKQLDLLHALQQRAPLTTERVDVVELVRSITGSVAALAEQRSVRLFQILPEELMMDSDRVWLSVLLSELLLLAIEETALGGSIHISVYPQDTQVGIGIRCQAGPGGLPAAGVTQPASHAASRKLASDVIQAVVHRLRGTVPSGIDRDSWFVLVPAQPSEVLSFIDAL